MSTDHRRDLLELWARLGYGARGVVYLLIGGLAAVTTFGSRGETTWSRGALRIVFEQPFGRVLLGAIAAGLAGFAFWRLTQAVFDPDHEGRDGKALLKRGGRAVSGFMHVGLTITTIGLILGIAVEAGEDGQATRDWTAWVLEKPLGRWLVGAAGVIVAGVGVGNALKGCAGNFAKYLRLDASGSRWAVPVARFGYTARALVFFIMGLFLLVAAWQTNSGRAKGLGGALDVLAAQPYGWMLLGATALGLAAFGAFGLIQARFRYIYAPRPGGVVDPKGLGA